MLLSLNKAEIETCPAMAQYWAGGCYLWKSLFTILHWILPKNVDGSRVAMSKL